MPNATAPSLARSPSWDGRRLELPLGHKRGEPKPGIDRQCPAVSLLGGMDMSEKCTVADSRGTGGGELGREVGPAGCLGFWQGRASSRQWLGRICDKWCGARMFSVVLRKSIR